MSAIKTNHIENSPERNQRLEQSFQAEFLPQVSRQLPLIAADQNFISVLMSGQAGARIAWLQYQPFAAEDVRRLQSIMDDLPQPTRLGTAVENVALERTSVAEWIEEISVRSQENARGTGVTLRMDLPADLPPALASPLFLRQALVILVGNAIKFTAAGGSVTVSAKHRERAAKFLLIQVRDTGCGISAEQLNELFEQTQPAWLRDGGKDQRRRMNLPTCKQLVNCQGGLIWANSEPGRGSVFSFTLPVFAFND